MKIVRFLLMTCLMLMSCVAAYADDGVAIEVVNKTGRELDVRLVTSSWEEKREISRTVAKDGTVRFEKSETRHGEGAMIPSWEIAFDTQCKYTIRSNEGQCAVVVGTSSCAHCSAVGDSCSLRFVVAE